jgi:diphthine-ammonia ligase
MRLAALYSGGKDSTFAVYRASEMGNKVVCLITLHPLADDSPLFHFPNSWVTRYLADAMQIPLIEFSIRGKAKDKELKALEEAIAQAKAAHRIDGIVHGGISSNYQKRAFEEICGRLGVKTVAPLWGANAQEYMNQLIDLGFAIVIVGVSAMGLEKEWLGRQIDEDALGRLTTLGKRYGFNLTFEGGEAETLVIDCPIFRKRLQINSAATNWDGQRGIFEIRDVSLVEK